MSKKKKKQFVQLINKVVNKKLKKERKRIKKQVKREVLTEVQQALQGGGGQQQQQPQSKDPLVNEVLQSKNTKQSMKEAVHQNASQEMSGGGPESKEENLQKVTETIRQQQGQGGGQQKQQINAQQQPQPQPQQGGAAANPVAAQAAGMAQGGGQAAMAQQQMPQGGAQAAMAQQGGGSSSPVSLDGGMPKAGSGALADAEKSTKKQSGQQSQQMGPQQGSREDWRSVDGNQQMGGGTPKQPGAAAQMAQGGASGQGAQVTPAQKANAPEHVKKAASRNYSDLINQFE